MRSRRIAILLGLLVAPLAPGAQPLASAPEDRAAELSQAPERARPLPAAVRPERASRVVALFDFEEEYTNPLEVPEGWVRGQTDAAIGREREGFPRFNRAKLDYFAPALQGEGSLRLEAMGGSGSLLMRPGVIPIFPGADYMIVASVRTKDATHARAVLAARLLDQSLDPIPGSESRSAPVRSNGAWTRMRTPVLGEFDNAAYLQLELLLLQPDQLDPDRKNAPFYIAQEDYSARAWFDDVGVVALPRIEIQIASPGSVAVMPERPVFELLVRDLAGDPLRIDAIITDAQGREVDRLTRRMPGGRLVETWTPQIDRLGWYRAVLEVRAGDTLVGSSDTPFAWVPPRRLPERIAQSLVGRPIMLEDWEQFGLVLERVPDPAIDDLVDLINASGVGSATIGAWGQFDDQDAQNAHMLALAPAINTLIDNWVRVTLSLASVPPDMAQSATIDRHDVLALLAGDESVWTAATAPLIDRFGQRVRRWQIGSPVASAPLEPTDLPAALDRIDAALSDMIPGPIIDIPWHTDDLLDPAAARWGRDITLLSIPGSQPDAYALLAQDWAKARSLAPVPASADPSDQPGLTFVIDPIDPESYGARTSAAEFVRHSVMFWGAFAQAPGSDADHPPRTTLALANPWVIQPGRTPHAVPTPAFPAMRALIDRLSGRRVTRTLDNHPGVRALLLEPAHGVSPIGAIVLWSEGAENATFELYLGDGGVTAVDIFGNHSPIDATMIPGLDIPLHRIEVTREPIFLEGVDTTLVKFLAALKLEPSMLASTGDQHEASLTIENPWRVPIRGAVYIVEPGGYSDPSGEIDRSWRISPRKVPFRLDAGARREFPVAVAFSLAEEAGQKRVIMDVEIIAERDHGVVRTDHPITVGLPGIDMDLSAQRVIGADGVEFVAVDLLITNRRAEPVSFDLIGVAPGRPRERTSVPELAPGEIAARTLAFEWDANLTRSRIAISLILPDDEGRLNKSVSVD